MIGLRTKPFQMKDLTYRVQKLPDDVLKKRMQQKFRTQSQSAEGMKLKVEQMKKERLIRQKEKEETEDYMKKQKDNRKKEVLYGKIFSDGSSERGTRNTGFSVR